MTIKDLMKQVPEEHWDKLILIDIPYVRAGDEGTFPLIQIDINKVTKRYEDQPLEIIEIILTADTY